MTERIQKAIEDLYNNQSISFEDKRKQLVELGNLLIGANSEIKRKTVEIKLAEEKKGQETQKNMDKFLSLSKEKDNIKNINLNLLNQIKDIKKTTEFIESNESKKRESYNLSFNELMKNLVTEYNYDEAKYLTVCEANKK